VSYSLRITDIAERDILASATHISDAPKNPAAANSLLDEIEKRGKTLEETPNIYPLVRDEHLAGKGLRHAPAKNYLLFFTADEAGKAADVVRFLHGRRNWKSILAN